MNLNMNILYALEELRVPFFNYLFLGISYVGAEAASAVAVFIIYWCVNKKDGLFVLANCLLASGANQIVKLAFHVQRPFVKHEKFSIVEEAVPTTGGFSFPSGHTQNSTSLFGSLAVILKKKSLRILCVVMIALVAFSRLYLGAHYPTDVLGGFVLGLIFLIFLSAVFRKVKDHPYLISALFGAGAIVMIAALLIFESEAWQEILLKQTGQEELKSMMKGLGICAGCALAVAVCEPIERKYVRFETDAVWWAQILKTVFGLGLIAVLALVMKYPAEAIFGENSLSYVLRFFVPAAFGICVWPLSFRKYPKSQSGAELN